MKQLWKIITSKIIKKHYRVGDYCSEGEQSDYGTSAIVGNGLLNRSSEINISTRTLLPLCI